MLRITTDDSVPTRRLIVEGRLKGNNVAELERSCAAEPGAVSLDLSNLIHVDEQGLRLLSALQGAGNELLNASPFIRMLLEQQRES